MKNVYLSLILVFLSGLYCSCTETIIELPSQQKTISCVRVIYPIDGLGDRSYIDGIYSGIAHCQNTLPEFAVENYCPESMRHAEGAIAEWLTQPLSPQFKNRLLILAGGAYDEILMNHPEWKIPEGDAILLLDYNGALPSPWHEVYTRIVSGYGLAYQAALLVRHVGAERTAVVCANPQLKALQDIRDGYIDGFRTAGGNLDDYNDIYYLGETASEGFSEAEKLYRMCFDFHRKMEYDFVLPVCGGSIQGLLRYTRDNPASFYTCGIDTDMQNYSSRVAFNLIKRMDLLVSDFLMSWLSGEEMEKNVTYGTDSQYAGLVLADRFLDEFPTINDVIHSFQKESMEAEEAYLNQ